MRLFTALWPSQEAIEHLASTIDGLDPARLAELTEGLRGFRFIPPERWHLTLRFHGDDAEQEHIVRRLDRRLARVQAEPPKLRLQGSGAFRGVLWVGLVPATESDAETVGELVRASGGQPGRFTAHLSVARWRGHAGNPSVTDVLTGYTGPWWHAEEITVVSSDLREGQPRYEVVHRVPVADG